MRTALHTTPCLADRAVMFCSKSTGGSIRPALVVYCAELLPFSTSAVRGAGKPR